MAHTRRSLTASTTSVYDPYCRHSTLTTRPQQRTYRHQCFNHLRNLDRYLASRLHLSALEGKKRSINVTNSRRHAVCSKPFRAVSTATAPEPPVPIIPHMSVFNESDELLTPAHETLRTALPPFLAPGSRSARDPVVAKAGGCGTSNSKVAASLCWRSADSLSSS